MSSIKSGLKKIGEQPSLRGVYSFLKLGTVALRDGAMASAVAKGKFNRGFCTICAKNTIFIERGEWLRDTYFCVDCYSVPRQRAIIHVLETRFPEWRSAEFHESSPVGVSSEKVASECRSYTSSHFMPDVEPGTFRDGIRCENLEKMTFADASFDLFMSQDVFEHVLDPAPAFAEVARVLRPGGSHVFTIPLYDHEKSLVRAVKGENGEIVHLETPDYHGEPGEGPSFLVATEWGKDFLDFIEKSSGMTTEVFRTEDKKLGLAGEYLEVFVSTKPA